MGDSLVTVATYRSATSAEVVCVLLNQEGIQAFVSDAQMVRAEWFMSGALGYAKLDVPESQVPQALDYLRAHPTLLDSTTLAAATDADGKDVCLACGAEMPAEADCCTGCGWTWRSGDDGAEPLDA